MRKLLFTLFNIANGLKMNAVFQCQRSQRFAACEALTNKDAIRFLDFPPFEMALSLLCEAFRSEWPRTGGAYFGAFFSGVRRSRHSFAHVLSILVSSFPVRHFPARLLPKRITAWNPDSCLPNALPGFLVVRVRDRVQHKIVTVYRIATLRCIKPRKFAWPKLRFGGDDFDNNERECLQPMHIIRRPQMAVAAMER